MSLVAKRLKYIERQRELHKERVDVVFEGRSPEGTGAANRHGMPKLPVGQRTVPNWPVLDLGDSPVIVQCRRDAASSSTTRSQPFSRPSEMLCPVATCTVRPTSLPERTTKSNRMGE